MRFAFIGGTCFLIEFSLIFLQVYFFGNYEITTTFLPKFASIEIYNQLAFAVALTINYIVSKLWVFESGRHTLGKEIMAFIGVAIVASILNILFFRVGLSFLKFDFLPEKYKWTPAKMFSVGLVLIWNFFMKKFFVFKG